MAPWGRWAVVVGAEGEVACRRRAVEGEFFLVFPHFYCSVNYFTDK